MYALNFIINYAWTTHIHSSPSQKGPVMSNYYTKDVASTKCEILVNYLEAISSKLLIVDPESDPQTRTSCLPPDIKADKHSVAFCSGQVNKNI